ncbi:hypothetical protein RND81_04G241600 [Saponaria officinalis]|uniref:Uncharacterized protein n=1 Tax=Saponaria officinalis TaxID=3572 RepID=A0AAW1LH41_SAPOF
MTRLTPNSKASVIPIRQKYGLCLRHPNLGPPRLLNAATPLGLPLLISRHHTYPNTPILPYASIDIHLYPPHTRPLPPLNILTIIIHPNRTSSRQHFLALPISATNSEALTKISLPSKTLPSNTHSFLLRQMV